MVVLRSSSIRRKFTNIYEYCAPRNSSIQRSNNTIVYLFCFCRYRPSLTTCGVSVFIVDLLDKVDCNKENQLVRESLDIFLWSEEKGRKRSLVTTQPMHETPVDFVLVELGWPCPHTHRK